MRRRFRILPLARLGLDGAPRLLLLLPGLPSLSFDSFVDGSVVKASSSPLLSSRG